MGVGEIAGLIAAIAFAVLAGFMIYPLIRLGKLFDQIAVTTTATNVGALVDLYGSFLGKPVIKAASAVYAAKSTIQSFLNKQGKSAAKGE